MEIKLLTTAVLIVAFFLVLNMISTVKNRKQHKELLERIELTIPLNSLSSKKTNIKKPTGNTLTIIKTFQDKDLNWWTLAQLKNRSRTIMFGNWGAAGDTLHNMRKGVCCSFGRYWLETAE